MAVLLLASVVGLSVTATASGHRNNWYANPVAVQSTLFRKLLIEGINGLVFCTGVPPRLNPRFFKHVACSVSFLDANEYRCAFYHPTGPGGRGGWTSAPNWWLLTHTAYGCKTYALRFLPT